MKNLTIYLKNNNNNNSINVQCNITVKNNWFGDNIEQCVLNIDLNGIIDDGTIQQPLKQKVIEATKIHLKLNNISYNF
jgi:citrate lyase gamma subunit